MTTRAYCVSAAAMLLAACLPLLSAESFYESTEFRSPYFHVVSSDPTGLVVEFSLPDPDAYRRQRVGAEELGMLEGPREGFLLAVPASNVPFPQVEQVAYCSIDGGTPVSGALAGKELSDASPHAAAVRRLLVNRELGWLRDIRLAAYQLRPVQRIYEGQDFRTLLYTRVRFRLDFDALPAARTEAWQPPEPWPRLMRALVLNPDDLPRLGNAVAAPPVEDRAPRSLPELYLKLDTAGEGIFEVTGGSILVLGATATAENLGLSAAGRPLPHLLLDRDGQRKTTGAIAPDDRLLFYRGGSRSPYSRYASTLLTLDGGVGAAGALETGAGHDAADTLPDNRGYEEDHEFASESEMGNGQADYWFWKSASAGPAGIPASMEVELAVPGIRAGTGQAEIELWAPSLRDLALRRNLELQWKGVVGEGEPVYETTSGKNARLILTQSLRADSPLSATAWLRIVSATGSDIYLDRIRLSYPRALAAGEAGDVRSGPDEARWLAWPQLPAEGAWLMVADATGALLAGRLTKEQPEARVPGGCRMALVAGHAPAPARIALRARPGLPATGVPIDALVIAHHTLIPALGPWLDCRRAQGRRIAIMDVEDFYDLFGDGSLSPEAIRRGLAHLFAHARLSGVILCGDASWDYWGRFPEPVPNWVPTYHLTPDYPSDLYYTTVCGNDPLPDLLLSRLPVQSATDLSAALDKIIHYPAAATGEWAGRFLMMADNAFEDYVQRLLGDSVPAHLGARMLRFVDYPLTDNFYYPEEMLRQPEFRIEGGKTSPRCTRTAISEMDRGNLVVMYFGHGGGNVMGHERYFFGGASPHSDVLKLRENVPAFFEIYSCWTGWFDFARPKWNIGLGEELLRTPRRGAAGLFLSTGRGLPVHHEVLARHFHRLVFDDGFHELGPAALGAQVLAYAETDNREPLEMFTLFGDFMLEIPVPKADLAVGLTPSSAAATAERTIRIAGLPLDTTSVALMAVDSEGNRLLDGRVPVSGPPDTGSLLVARLPGCATAYAGPLRIAIAAGTRFGGATGEIVAPDLYAHKPPITDGTPDLAIVRGDVALVTPDPMDGETVVFDVTVENRGTATASHVQIEAYNGEAGNPEHRLTNQVMLPPVVVARLDPGEKAVRRIRWDPWDNAGPHTLFFVVDPRFQIPERSERNNMVSLPIAVRRKADLTLEGKVARATDESGLMLYVVVRNRGESVARVEEGELLVILRFLGAHGLLKTIEIASLSPLAPGATKALPPVPIPTHVAGKHGQGEVESLEVEVDPVGIANETTHKNNRAVLRVSGLMNRN